MSAKFTPGPWMAKPPYNSDDTCRIMWTEYGQGWTRERRLDRDCAGGFSPENARLMAAAPELYEALLNLRGVIDAAGVHNLSNGVQLGQVSWAVKCSDAMQLAKDALAKACKDGKLVSA